jgi:hypothetical protein
MTCRICEENKQNRLQSPEGRPRSVDEFQESRRDGCWLCSTVLDAVDVFQPGWTSDHVSDGMIACANISKQLLVKTLPPGRMPGAILLISASRYVHLPLPTASLCGLGKTGIIVCPHIK